ncbi:hypothetical protein ACWJKU_07460 [Methylocaldum sp. MU1018]
MIAQTLENRLKIFGLLRELIDFFLGYRRKTLLFMIDQDQAFIRALIKNIQIPVAASAFDHDLPILDDNRLDGRFLPFFYLKFDGAVCFGRGEPKYTGYKNRIEKSLILHTEIPDVLAYCVGRRTKANFWQ